MMDISNFIKQSRKERGISQKQLAEYAGVSFTLVNRIENGDLNLQVIPLNKILDVFGHKLGAVPKNSSDRGIKEIHSTSHPEDAPDR